MKTRRISLAYPDGETREVDALVYGPFGIHPTGGALRAYFTVTHIATGYAAAQFIESEAAALKLARMLIRCGIDWNFSTPAQLKRIVGHPKGVATLKRWRQLAAEARA